MSSCHTATLLSPTIGLTTRANGLIHVAKSGASIYLIDLLSCPACRLPFFYSLGFFFFPSSLPYIPFYPVGLHWFHAGCFEGVSILGKAKGWCTTSMKAGLGKWRAGAQALPLNCLGYIHRSFVSFCQKMDICSVSVWSSSCFRERGIRASQRNVTIYHSYNFGFSPFLGLTDCPPRTVVPSLQVHDAGTKRTLLSYHESRYPF